MNKKIHLQRVKQLNIFIMDKKIQFKVSVSVRSTLSYISDVNTSFLIKALSLQQLFQMLRDYADYHNLYFDITSIEVVNNHSDNPMFKPLPF